MEEQKDENNLKGESSDSFSGNGDCNQSVATILSRKFSLFPLFLLLLHDILSMLDRR